MVSTGNSIMILVVGYFLVILETRLVRVLSKCRRCLGERCAQVDSAWCPLLSPAVTSGSSLLFASERLMQIPRRFHHQDP